MRFNKRVYGALLVVIFAVTCSVVVPFYLSDTSMAKLNASVGLIGGISTVITLLIALYLFNRFGLENEVLGKKANVVFLLMSELKKLRFLLTMKNGGMIQYFPSVYHTRQQRELLEGWMNYELLFTTRYFGEMQKFIDLMNDVFMPLEIREKLLPMCEIFVITTEPMTDKHLGIGMSPMVFKVGVSGSENNRINEERLRNEPCGLLNKKVITFREFTNQWEAAIEATKSWLKQHSSHHEVNL